MYIYSNNVSGIEFIPPKLQNISKYVIYYIQLRAIEEVLNKDYTNFYLEKYTRYDPYPIPRESEKKMELKFDTPLSFEFPDPTETSFATKIELEPLNSITDGNEMIYYEFEDGCPFESGVEYSLWVYALDEEDYTIASSRGTLSFMIAEDEDFEQYTDITEEYVEDESEYIHHIRGLELF